jgi:hypothetical protein
LLFAEQDLVIPPAAEQIEPSPARNIGGIDERAIRRALLLDRDRRRVEL